MASSVRESEQSYHHGSLRSALLVQAEIALAEVGVEGLSLRHLARELGVSHGAPARHFDDKQALLDALALQGFQTMNASLTSAVNQPSSLRSRFDDLVRAYVRFALEHPELLQLMYSRKHHESATEQLRTVGHEGMLIARGLLLTAQDEGELAPGDADLLSAVATAHVHGIAVLASANMLDGVATDDAVATTTNLLWIGLGGK
jgi:AcrR family transcriptional regulator